MDPNDRVTAKALLRYQIISAYLAAEPRRGERGQNFVLLSIFPGLKPDCFAAPVINGLGFFKTRPYGFHQGRFDRPPSSVNTDHQRSLVFWVDDQIGQGFAEGVETKYASVFNRCIVDDINFGGIS